MDKYCSSAAKSFRGQCRRRIETLDGLRQGVFVKHLNAVGKDEELASRFELLLHKYADMMEAARLFYQYLYGRVKKQDE